MLLPQSSAFAALKNRLNSVSSIGYLHIAPRPYVTLSSAPPPSHSRQGSVVEAINSLQSSPRKNSNETHAIPRSNATTPSGSSFDRPNRLKGREDGIIRWTELLEKFRSVQERARRAQRHGDHDEGSTFGLELHASDGLATRGTKETVRGPPVPMKDTPGPAPPPAKPRSGLGRQFGRLGGAVSGRGKRNQQ
jgi:vacuole morphology and inheritance protein 14